MKLTVCLIFLLSSLMVLSQEESTVPLKRNEFSGDTLQITGSQSHSYIPAVKCGVITLTDGTTAKFTRLISVNDSVYFQNSLRSVCKFPLSQVERIGQVKSETLSYSLGGMVGGFFVGVIVGGLVHPERTFWEFLGDKLEKNDELRITKKQAPYVVGGTVAGALIGALIGSGRKTDVTVFQRELSLNIYPEIRPFSSQNQGLMFTCRISLH